MLESKTQESPKVSSSRFNRIRQFPNRASRIFDPEELQKMKPVSIQFKPKSQTRSFPKRSRTVLPTTNQSSLKKLRKSNVVFTSLLSLIIIVGCIYECQSILDSDFELKSQNNSVRLFIAGLAFLQVLIVIFYSLIVIKVKKSYKIISKHSSVYQDKDIFYKLIVEILICLVITPPYFSYKFEIQQLSIRQTITTDHVLLGFVFLRAAHLYKVYYEFSYFNSVKSKFYCDLQKVDDPFKFTMRCFLKDMPFTSVLIMFTQCTLWFGLLLYFYEQSVPDSPFSYVWNGFWLVSYTQSTIGYGEMTPRTHLGRLAIILSSFIGLFLYSYIVLMVRTNTLLNERQSKLYFAIKHKRVGVKNLIKPATQLLQRWWVLTMKRKRKSNKIQYIFQFNSALAEFSYQRAKEEQEINPTLNEEIKRISRIPVKRLENLSKSLDPVFESQKVSQLCASKMYGIKRKLAKFNKTLRALCGTNVPRQSQNLLGRNSKVCKVGFSTSKVVLKKLRGEAVKKMIKSRIEKNILNTHGSVSSDEDFYSNKSQ